MGDSIFSRTELLIGKESIERLKKSKVAIIGIGGVGSFTAEALARAGVGTLIFVDVDIISPSNLNRQIHALHSTLGLPKVDAMKQRILDINPDATVRGIREFYSTKNAASILTRDYDFVVDAIDSISSKVNLIINCKIKYSHYFSHGSRKQIGSNQVYGRHFTDLHMPNGQKNQERASGKTA